MAQQQRRGLATADGVSSASNQVLSPVVMQRLRGMQVTGYPNQQYVSASPVSDALFLALPWTSDSRCKSQAATFEISVS